MIKCASFPDKIFETKSDLFKSLLENEERLISIKKAAVQKSCDKGQLTSFKLLKVDENTKSLFGLKSDFVYPVINTTKYFDSHEDVHFDGIWDKSVKDQQGKLYYVADHELKVSYVIAWPEDVKPMIKTVPWSFVGKEYEGNTQALIYEIEKSKIEHIDALKIIEKNRPVQNSVRMQYVNVKLAINDSGKDFAQHKAYYDSRINEIANKEAAEEAGFFWGIEQAKIVNEGSMVLFGSNDATPIKYFEAVNNDTDKTEPPKGTQPSTEKKFTFLKLKKDEN